MHVSTWPEMPGLDSLFDRLRQLHPQEPTQTHILHLASDGEIFVSKVPYEADVGAHPPLLRSCSHMSITLKLAVHGF